MNGSELLARALKRQGADTFFYIMGGPMMAAETATMAEGLKGVDVRHEQAAAMMAHAYARLRNRPGICMAASGPATTNLLTGVAHAWADGVPIIAFGGASPVSSWGTGAFQEMDQLTCFEPCTKWSARGPSSEPRAPSWWSRPSSKPCQASPARCTSTCPVTSSIRTSTSPRSSGQSLGTPPIGARPAADSSGISAFGGHARQGEPAGDHLGQRCAVVRSFDRVSSLRGADRHSVLHHPAKPWRHPGGPRLLLSDCALNGVPARPISSSFSGPA